MNIASRPWYDSLEPHAASAWSVHKPAKTLRCQLFDRWMLDTFVHRVSAVPINSEDRTSPFQITISWA